MKGVIKLLAVTALIGAEVACATTREPRSLASYDDPRLEKIGDANWSEANGVVKADSGKGFLITEQNYDDFVLSVEFKAGPGTNSGIFFRCHNAKEINDANCFEANIFDTRPDQTFRTGAITTIASPSVSINTEDGQWHKYMIEANGPRIRIILDGRETVLLRSTLHKSGPIALQYAGGTIEFRKLRIQRLDPQTPRTAIDGVWELTSFKLTDSNGKISEWCEGSHGVIMYTEGYMSTAVNCKSDLKKVLLYSGPFVFDGKMVHHDARNFSDSSLNRVFPRIVTIDGDRLTLSGPLPNGGKATVEWRRR